MKILGIMILLLAAVLITRERILYTKSRKLTPKENKVSYEKNVEYAEKLQQMIRCKTVYEKENYNDIEFSKLRAVMKDNFPLLHKTAKFMTFSDDCWIYVIEGENKENCKNIMIMSHHDVVKADEKDWKYESFSGIIKEDKIWGRGTVDTKTPLFSEFQAIEELLQNDFKPSYNLYIGSSHNEEVGGDGIPLALKYFKENNIIFDLVLDEGGAIIDPPIGGMKCKCAMLAVHEKGRYTLKCIAKNDTLHAGLSSKSATPTSRMASFIDEISKKNIYIRKIYPEVQMMFEDLCPYMGFGMRIVFSNLWLFKPILKGIIPKLNEQAAAMLGTTGSFTSIIGGKENKENPNECKADLFLRCVDIKDLECDIESIKNIAKKYNIHIQDSDEGNEFYTPADTRAEGYKLVKQCVETIFPHVASAPFILPAGTDARHLTDICDCVIRFAPIDIDTQQFKSVHSVNENIDVDAIGYAVEFYKYLLKNYI